MSLRSDEETIQAILDGKLDARSFAAFEKRLLSEPDLRALFLSYSRMEHVLEEKFAHSEPSVVPMTAPAKPRRQALALAACAAGLGVASFLVFDRPEPDGTVLMGPQSHGRIVQDNAVVNSDQLQAGSIIELDHGSASVTLRSGAHAYFEGPGSLRYLGDQTFHLEEGRAWFDSPEGVPSVICFTQDLRIDTPTGEFGLIADRADRQELHVLRGAVKVTTPNATQELRVGESARWDQTALATRQNTATFSSGFPQAVTVFSENFDEPDLTPLAGKQPDVGSGAWSVELGGPVIEHGVLDTSGNLRHAAFAPIGGTPLDELSHILLLTLTTENPDTSRFHSEGWAGVSLYTGDQERIFVGDPNGPERGWALHPVGYDARHACPLLNGKTTVTLRYDFRSGLAQLFEGTETSGPALASEWISPGLSFDRLRIANGSQADAAVDAGKDASAAGSEPGVEERGDIALREIKVTVLSAGQEIRTAQP